MWLTPYFINIFYAFVLDEKFGNFEHANYIIQAQIHLTSFIEFTKILNQTQKQLFGAELFCIKSFLKILAKILEKNLKKSYSLK